MDLIINIQNNVFLISNHVPIRVIKTWLIVTIVLAIIIALVVIFTIAKNQMSPENKRLTLHMLSKDDAKSLSKQLTSNDHRLSEEEARAYLKYIKAENDLKHVADKVEENTKDIKIITITIYL